MSWKVTQQQLDDYMQAENESILNQLIKSKIKMVHFNELTGVDTLSKGGFLLLKDRGIFNENEYLVVTTTTVIPSEIPEQEPVVNYGQAWFQITQVLTAKSTPGVKRGFAMVKVKRVKNPIPKTLEQEPETTDNEA
jgi:hypothetical protein